MDLNFEEYCGVDPSPRYAKHEKRSKKGRSSLQNDKVNLEGDFREIKLRNCHRSASFTSLASRNNELSVDSRVLKRGSFYQSSEERDPLKGLESVGERKKIEVSLGDTPFDFILLDSICGSDEEEDVCLQESSNESSSVKKLDIRETGFLMPAERNTMESPEMKSHQISGPTCNPDILKKKDTRVLQYSLSSNKSRFTSIRKMFDPLTKSKSYRSPLSSTLESNDVSSLRDLPSTDKKDCGGEYTKNVSIPGHLYGDLKSEHKHGVPYFEFSLTHSEELFVAKTWKAEDKLNWVYTFHSVQGGKKSNASGSGIRYSNKELPITGQMQVTCHLLSELKNGAFSDSLLTEFVLYDIMQARKGEIVSDESFDPGPFQIQNTNTSEKRSSDFFSPYPWATADLHPSLESVAVVIRVPLKKRESLKYSSGDSFSNRVKLNLLDDDVSLNGKSVGVSDGSGTRVNVVMPMGNHGLPTCESDGPSPLLDRWRLGGGCDCGGWDAACPLVVLSNRSAEFKDEHSFMQNDRPFELYIEGTKGKTPAVNIQFFGKGQYAVDFHAQLSSLQAFAISVAILHATEASAEGNQAMNMQCNTPKAFLGDEVKTLIESVTEEAGKENARRRVQNHSSSFMLNPPFSPISRV